MSEENLKKFLQSVNMNSFTKANFIDMVASVCPRAVISKVRLSENVFEIHVDPEYMPAVEFIRLNIPIPITVSVKACALNPLSDFTGYVWLE